MNAQTNNDSTLYASQSHPSFQDKTLTAQLQELADFVNKSSQTSTPAHEVEKGIWEVTEILDLIHVASYLWKAAHLFHPKHSTEALLMVKEQMALILNSETECVIDRLDEKAGRRGLSAKKQLELDKILLIFREL